MDLSFKLSQIDYFPDDDKWKLKYTDKKLSHHSHHLSGIHVLSGNMGRYKFMESNNSKCLFCEGAQYDRQLIEILHIYTKHCDVVLNNDQVKWRLIKHNILQAWENGIDAWGNMFPCTLKPAKN